MAPDASEEGRKPGRKVGDSGFIWLSPSPSPEVVSALEERFPDVVQLPVEVLEREIGIWEETAVLVRSFARWVPSDAIIREFRRCGVSGDIAPVSLAHRTHIFRFSDPQAKDLVLSKPWIVNGLPLAMEGWRPEFIPSPASVSSALLWVRLPCLAMEFWSDEVLAAILAPAGHFAFSDSATQLKNRGGFARVCVRVDLTKPLRPGARIRGKHAPFWQPFVFEHLEGICSSCGSLHLLGPCSSSSPSPSGAPSSGLLYGPWMAAIRHRRVALPETKSKNLDASSTHQRPNPPSSSLEHRSGSSPEDWKLPAKVARRRLPKTFSPLVFAAGGLRPPEVGMVSGVKDCSGVTAAADSLKEVASLAASNDCVPVEDHSGVPTVAECLKGVESKADSQLNLKLNQKMNTKLHNCQVSENPFALLGSDRWAGRPTARRDANPGPSKRARPEVALAQRISPKNDKRKGKSRAEASLTLAADHVELTDVCIQSSYHQDSVLTEAAAQPSIAKGRTHELVLPCLKKAEQGEGNSSELITVTLQGEVTPAETVEDVMDCTTQKTDVGSVSTGSMPDTAMHEDPAGSHPPPN